MARAERVMSMGTKRAMASDDNNNDHNNNSNRDNNYNQGNSSKKGDDTSDDKDNKNNGNGNKDGIAAAAAAVVSGFVSSISVSGGDCGGIGGGGFGRWRVVAVVGVVVCRTTTAMRGIHNNQPKEGCVAKMPATEVKQHSTTSWRNKRMRGWHNMNTSAMTARQRWQQW
jgi:hypothetical protein